MAQERTMKQGIQRHHWKQNPESELQKEEKQKKIDGKFINFTPKSYLVESFVLNSVDRVISKKGKGRRPDPSYPSSIVPQQLMKVITQGSGKKINEVDLDVIGSVFEKYTQE